MRVCKYFRYTAESEYVQRIQIDSKLNTNVMCFGITSFVVLNLFGFKVTYESPKIIF